MHGQCRPPLSSAFHCHNLLVIGPPVSLGTDVRKDDSAGFWRFTRGLEHVDGVLSGSAFAQSVWIHSIAASMPLFVLFIGIRSVGNLNMVVNHPAIAVVMIAVSSLGLPFFMVAASAPLLQKWLSQTNHLDASDPYFLYAASNAGSLIGLALYPCLLEPAFRTGQQAVIWSVGYAVFLALTIASGLAACRWHTPAAVQ